MQQKSSQRVVYLDLLRLVATFAVILLHVCSSEFDTSFFSLNWCISTVYNSLVRWCVPMFVMISGVLFLNPNKEITYQEILKKKIPRLFQAYIFGSVFYVMYGFIISDFANFSILHLVRRTILTPIGHLWFLPMLMGVYILIPILRKIAQDNKLLHYALIIWLVFVFISFFQFLEVFKLVYHFYPLFKMNSVVGYSGYFLFGYFLSRQDFSKRQRIWIYLVGIAGALVTLFGTIHVSISLDEANGIFFSYLSLQTITMSTALFVLVKELVPKCGKHILKFIDFVRKDLFGIYLTHMLWIFVLDAEAIRHCCSEIITLPMITIIVFLLSLFTTKLIRLVPGLRKVVE